MAEAELSMHHMPPRGDKRDRTVIPKPNPPQPEPGLSIHNLQARDKRHLKPEAGVEPEPERTVVIMGIGSIPLSEYRKDMPGEAPDVSPTRTRQPIHGRND